MLSVSKSLDWLSWRSLIKDLNAVMQDCWFNMSLLWAIHQIKICRFCREVAQVPAHIETSFWALSQSRVPMLTATRIIVFLVWLFVYFGSFPDSFYWGVVNIKILRSDRLPVICHKAFVCICTVGIRPMYVVYWSMSLIKSLYPQLWIVFKS